MKIVGGIGRMPVLCIAGLVTGLGVALFKTSNAVLHYVGAGMVLVAILLVVQVVRESR